MSNLNTLPDKWKAEYKIDKKYSTSAVYFCMEFGIDQALKIYSGGLGYLAGSHMRSGYDLKQNLVGIGILWKYGYYDQFKKEDRNMGALFQEKIYHFLEDTGKRFTIDIHGHPVVIKAMYLRPEIFGTVPMFFLSTDVPENDYLAQSTTFRLYDSDPNAKIAQSIVLGAGGAKLIDELGFEPDVYHLNEAHALSAAFHLYNKFGNVEDVKKRLVTTTHTPVEAGNEKHDINLLHSLNFFCGLPLDKVREITGIKDDTFDHTLVALRMSRLANGVSKLHGEVARDMWSGYDGVCEITHITNAQNRDYWQDQMIRDAQEAKDIDAIKKRKRRLKEKFFKEVADQTGKLYDPDVLTIVWARRFAGYKRADLITKAMQRFKRLLESTERPVQIIWGGKPYPMDYTAISTYDSLTHLSKNHKNMAVLAGYELSLSRQMKEGADIWLNNPRVTREASGTSGMTAAMNGSLNFSTDDGWIREFKEMGDNSFVLPIADLNKPIREQDEIDLMNMYDMLEDEILPLYYDTPEKWWKKVQTSMDEVVPFFDSNRMADEYYSKLYNAKK